MSQSNQHTNFHRSNHTTRRTFSNLLKFFNPRNNFIFTWNEILAVKGISLALGLAINFFIYFVFVG